MSAAYNCELAFRTVDILATSAGDLRQRLPMAWDEGLSMINPDNLPSDCALAKNELVELRRVFSRENDSYFAREFGMARANIARKHRTTLEKLAHRMTNVQADLNRHFEYSMKGTHR